MDSNGTGIMFRFWTVERPDGTRGRCALWRVYYDGRYEYHVSGPGAPRIEDFSAEVAMYRAGACRTEYRKLTEWEVAA